MKIDSNEINNNEKNTLHSFKQIDYLFSTLFTKISKYIHEINLSQSINNFYANIFK